MRRADRLFQIVQYLRGGRLLTAAKLSERLEVSERTIYRDIADLQASGVPIDGEAGVGYVLRAGYDVPPLMFSRDEVVALIAGARLIKAWGGASMARAAEEALVKIDAVLPEAARPKGPVEIHSISFEMQPETRVRIDELEAAAEARQVLRFAYSDRDGKETERTVRPLGLWFWGKAWTLVAWCELREDFRVFRIDRIGPLEIVGKFRPERGKTLAEFLRRMEAEHGPLPD